MNDAPDTTLSQCERLLDHLRHGLPITAHKALYGHGVITEHDWIEEERMILSERQCQEMLDAAKPLIKWMNENCHPHCTALVDQMTIELVEGIATNATEEFLRD